jgi:PAT family beta-lactamase induction signal transducer AmpG
MGLLIPYLLRSHGVPVDRIAGVAALAGLPGIISFLWAPIVDLGLRRRTWIVISCALAATSSCLAILQSRGQADGSLGWLTAFWFAGNAGNCLTFSATGAALASLQPDVHGRASGWIQVGNVGAGALAGGGAIWLAGKVDLPVLAVVSMLVLFLPSLAALRITEDLRPRMAPIPLLRALAGDIRNVLWSRRTAVGLLFFLSPVGAGELGGLISSVGPDYHVSSGEVAWMSGLGGGLLLAFGGLLGGFVCDRMHRMTAYALFGILAAVFAAWLALGPATAFTYGAAYAGYAFSTGLASAAFVALVLDVLGRGRRAAATGFSLLFSCGNLPVAYMKWVDGLGYRHSGARGLMGADALASGIGGLVLLLIARYCARRWRSIDPATLPAPVTAPLS